MGLVEDGAAGGLVDAAALHADEAVLDQVDPADAVLAAEFVELGQQFGRRQTFAVHGDGIALLEIDFDILRLGRAHLPGDGQHVHVFRWLRPRGLRECRPRRRCAAGCGRMLQGLLAGRYRDAVLRGVLLQGRAAVQVPLAPGGDDLDRRVEVIVGELETHLVVALAGGAVGDGVGAFLAAISICALAISGRAIEVPRK